MTTRRRAKQQQRVENMKLKPLSAKTENQKNYIRDIAENDIILCTGPAGSGKSFIASGIAAEKLDSGQIEQIIVTRPLHGTGKDIGALPGDVREKVMPHLIAMEENLKFFFGRIMYSEYYVNNQIRYEPLELMRGATFNNAIMILDEAQNCSLDQIKMFITRMGENSKVIINGDINQSDIYNSGLLECIKKLEGIPKVAISKLKYTDIQRNGIIGHVLAALESHEEYRYD